MTASASPTPRLSGFAAASMVAGLVLFCPLTTIAAPILGVVGLRNISRHNHLRGRAMAVTGIVLGGIATVGWLSFGLWWNGAVRQQLIDGPREALMAGFAGDAAGFRSYFTGVAADASDADVNAFLSELSNRYGRFHSASQSDLGAAGQVRAQTIWTDIRTTGRAPISYILEFDPTPREAQARFVMREDGSQLPVAKFDYLAVFDADQGDLVFPAAMRTEALAERESMEAIVAEQDAALGQDRAEGTNGDD